MKTSSILALSAVFALLSEACNPSTSEAPTDTLIASEVPPQDSTPVQTASTLCRIWNGEQLTSHGKPDPSREVKGKVRFELRCDSSFNMSDATEGTLETVSGTWTFTKDSLLILNIPDEGELTRFKVLAWDTDQLRTFILEAPEEEVIVTYSAE